MWRGLLLLGVWLAGDFVYSRTIAWRAGRWERSLRRDPDGVRPEARDFTVGSGEPAVLLIHGFGDAPPIFRPLAERLASRGITCRVMRVPGFGVPVKAARGIGLADWRRAVDGEVDALNAVHARVWAVGHSLGATLALDAALRRPEAVAGVGLLSPLLEVSSRRTLGIPPRWIYEGMRRLLVFTDAVEPFYPLDARDPAARAYEYHDLFLPISIYAPVFELLDDVRPRAADLAAPVFLAYSPDDCVVNPAIATCVCGRMHAARKAQLALPDAGHVLPLDYGHDRLADALADFIRAAGAYR